MMLMKDWGVFHKSPPPAEWEGPDVMFFSNASDDDWYRSIAHVKDPDFVTVIVDDATAKVIAAHRDPSALVPLDARVLTFTDTGQDTVRLWRGGSETTSPVNSSPSSGPRPAGTLGRTARVMLAILAPPPCAPIAGGRPGARPTSV